MRAASKLISSTHPSLHLSHPTPDSFTWNTLIRAHTRSVARPSLSVYLRMRLHAVLPDLRTFPFLLQSFASPSNLQSGKRTHAHILRSGFASDAFVQTSLINMYSTCGCLDSAHQVFGEIPLPDLPSWNSIISANVKSGFVGVARHMFDEMPQRNVISWSCMIDGYVRSGDCKEALALFRDMQLLEVEEVRPNEYTMSSVLSACGRLGALEHGKWVHAYIDKCGMEVDVVLGTSLIDMYAKCGSVERARQVFTELGWKKDVMAWSAMISGLAMHGHGKECLDLFSRMQDQWVRPNAVTFLAVLCACVHAGLVSKGMEYFEMMREEFGITPTIQHYGSIVDLYGRAGLIEKAWDVVKSMPMKPDVLIWGALLSGSRMHGDVEMCEFSIKQLIELEPNNSGAYVLLSNVYAKMGRWEDVRYVRDLMEAKGIRKVPGCSMVEVGGILHEFFVGDESHPETREIYQMLEEIMKKLKLAGYVGNTREVLLDLDEEGKELALSLHSEKLAIAFSFIKTRPGTPIRIVKNLRICVDCHVAIKLISRVFNREIVVRDCNRFHHFRYGLCSCKDYW
ncbi:pentatricopeptide repeat-containing protein At3g62890 [Magnolia sinica]|uniref:pentatricopeptide repeat-containing protein At3g62890 n=1 Tax=Magnolia sinica TaxID=86752 RepID=UPI0026597234|nr:pentatricopeptide repeat-containing protein At3g62890 [Magnolia sinica]